MSSDAGLPGAADQSSAQRADLSVRASDAERERVAELLGEHAAAGRITLGELEDRVGRAYAAVTRAELVALTRDLPQEAGALTTDAVPDTGPPERPARTRNRWFVSIMGGSTRRGKRRLSGRLTVLSLMGGDDIDLREAEIEGRELVIDAISLMGGSCIYVPDTLEVELTGPAIMGGNDERGSQRAARPGAPLIRIRSFAVMGGVEVWRIPAEARGKSLKEAKRAAKALEKGES